MIIKGSNWFVDSAVWIAKILKVPDIIIGATLVSLCTTLPEAMVSTSSALKGNTDMAVGNALGSIACNTGLILAITIIFSRPALHHRKNFQQKGLLLFFLLLFIAVIGFLFGEISRYAGIILLSILGIYIYTNIRESLRSEELPATEPLKTNRVNVIQNIILFIIGLLFTVSGANLLVANGEIIASMFGVPDLIVGITMTSLGTSLPELITAFTAIRKKAHNLSIGNVLGANILNIILVIGITSVILPIRIGQSIMYFHLPFILILVGSGVSFAFTNKHRFKRRNGILLMLVYAIYLGLIFINVS